MLRTLLESRGRAPRRRIAVVTSAIAHGALVGTLVMARGERVAAASEPVRTPVVFFPPQVHAQPQRPPRRIRADRVPLPNAAVSVVLDDDRFRDAVQSIGEVTPIMLGWDAFGVLPNADPGLPNERVLASAVRTALTVDDPVVMLPRQAPPRYPMMLERAGVVGDVVAQFVVDTAGRVEPGGINVLHSSHDEFSRAVRQRLLTLRFVPARAGGRVVRQLVQQQFRFEVVRAPR